MARRYDLDILIGLDLGPIVLALKDGDGAPLPLNGSFVAAHVRKVPMASLLIDLNPSVTDEENGEITVHLTAEQTAVVPEGRHGWDMVLTDAAGRKTIILAGSASATKPYTHA